MGLDFKYINKNNNETWANCSFSYSGFHKFRKKLAEKININLDEMAGYCEDENSKLKEWNKVDDHLKIILNHADNEGEIKFLDLIKLVNRLNFIYFQEIKNDEETININKIFIIKLRDMIELIDECIENESDLIFT